MALDVTFVKLTDNRPYAVPSHYSKSKVSSIMLTVISHTLKKMSHATSYHISDLHELSS